MRAASYSHGNLLSLLHRGAEFFPALLLAIDTAQTEIYLETYIFSEDEVGQRVKAALLQAAERGVKVHVLVDWLGTGQKHVRVLEAQMAAAGIQFAAFNPWFRRGMARMHRKITVIDRRIAFLGGLNINDDFLSDDDSRKPLPAPRWDLAVSITGPLVTAIHKEVMIQWTRLSFKNLRARLESLRLIVNQVRPMRSVQVAEAVLVVRDNLRNRHAIQRSLLHALGRAHQSALLVTPYFAPGRKLRKALIHAAERGVDVSLLIGVGQFAMQDAVAQSFYPRLLRAGVKVVEYRHTQLHGKVAVIDEEWVTLGSSNFDGLSLFVNHEANIIVRDAAFAATLGDMVFQGVAEGVMVTAEDVSHLTWPRRIWNRFSYWLYRLVLGAMTAGRYTK